MVNIYGIVFVALAVIAVLMYVLSEMLPKWNAGRKHRENLRGLRKFDMSQGTGPSE